MGINVLQSQNNLIWLPIVTSVPAILALWVLPRTRHPPVTSQPRPRGGGAGGDNAGGGGASPYVAPQCNPGRAIHNANRDPRCVGETSFAVNVRTRCVAVTILMADTPSLKSFGMEQHAWCASRGTPGVNILITVSVYRTMDNLPRRK
jgi:hypothetical protein